MATLITNPGVRIVIYTRSSGPIDVTNDIENGQLSIRENNYHSLKFQLSNADNKYSSIFTPNDRVVVQMKRMQWLQVYSGYLDIVPYFSVFQRSVSLSSTCTLKRLRFHYWDPGLPASLDLISASLGQETTQPDAGMSSLITALLTQVADWPTDQIHIGAVPTDWMSKIASIYSQEQQALNAIANAAGGTVTSGQPSGSAGGNLSFDQIAQLWVNAGGDPGWANLAAAIAMAESGGNSTIQNSSGSSASGLWQDETPTWLGNGGGQYAPTAAQASPANQATVNVAISSNGTYWKPWQTDRAWVAWQSHGAPSKPTKAQVYSWGLNFLGSQTSATTAAPTSAVNVPPPAVTGSNTSGGIEAADYAISLIGVPYVWGGATSSGVDCSGLVMLSWSKAGVSLPHYTGAQIALCTSIQQSQLQAGDLAFCEFDSNGVPQHVGMFVGNDTIVAAPYTGKNVSAQSTADWLTGEPDTHWYRVPGFTTGTGTLSTTLASDNSGNGSGGSTGSTTGTQGQQLIDGQWYPNNQYTQNPISAELTGIKSLMNDTPLLPTITALVQAGLRHYCSAPNGDFIAWFPDYFGQYGFAAQWYLSPLEMQDFQINWSDQQMVTHQFTSGADPASDLSPVTSGPAGSQPTGDDLLYSQGVATIDIPGLFDALFNISPGETGLFANATEIYQQFGPRPNFQALPLVINDNPVEFWYALSLWQQNWASQFTANVSTTFLPEVWPGMLLVIQDAQVQCYVTGVTHSFDLSESGGFQTQISVSSPSALDGSGLIGLARGG